MDDLLKDMKEKFKGWVNCSTSEQAELAYKKVKFYLIFNTEALGLMVWPI